MTLLQRLHDSEISASIRTVQYAPRPFYWQVFSPFGTAGKSASGESPTLADAEAQMREWAIKLFPDSEFAQTASAPSDGFRPPVIVIHGCGLCATSPSSRHPVEVIRESPSTRLSLRLSIRLEARP